jgi:DNA mismatch repair protein MSH4
LNLLYSIVLYYIVLRVHHDVRENTQDVVREDNYLIFLIQCDSNSSIGGAPNFEIRFLPFSRRTNQLKNPRHHHLIHSVRSLDQTPVSRHLLHSTSLYDRYHLIIFPIFAAMSSSNQNSNRRGKRKGASSAAAKSTGNAALEDKVRGTGGRLGFALDGGSNAAGSTTSGLYGANSAKNNVPRKRLFQQQAQGAASVLSRKSRASTKKSTSTPFTARYSTNNSMDQTSVHVVCAISENLAKETCVASIDAGSPVSLHVVKQGNGQTYAETLAYLDILQPDEILLNEGRRNSHLAQKVLARYSLSQMTMTAVDTGFGRKTQHRSYFQKKQPTDDTTTNDNAAGAAPNLSSACETSTVIKFVPRSFFDQTKGADLLRRIARSDSYDASVVEEYILLSSSYAVLQYTQLCLGASFSKNCLHLSVNAGGRSRMAIDRSSLLHLELLANAKTGKMANSLIGTIDCTKTTVGSRLLRSNLMAPPTDIDTINTRLDLVEAFISDEEFFYGVMDHLQGLPDVNRMLAGIALSPWKKGKKGEESVITHRIASKGISALVCIKSVLAVLPAFAQVLEDQLNAIDARDRSMGNQQQNEGDGNYEETLTDGSSLLVGLGEASTVGGAPRLGIRRHHLLRAIIYVMRQPELNEVLTAVSDIFTDSTSYVRKAEAMRHQECFALKPKTDGMLDVIRRTFLANVDDIYRLADEYAEQYEIRVQVKHSTQRGYFLAIPGDMAVDLPDAFIQPIKAGRFINCTTEEVHSLNSRAQDNIQDLLLLTHEHIQEVLDFAREKYDSIASLSDAIALLDLCHAFADNVASSRLPWTRPVVTIGNDFTIRNGRYAIDVPTGHGTEDIPDAPSEQYVPNHTYAPGHRNFVVLTGANGSGKVSLYL